MVLIPHETTRSQRSFFMTSHLESTLTTLLANIFTPKILTLKIHHQDIYIYIVDSGYYKKLFNDAKRAGVTTSWNSS